MSTCNRLDLQTLGSQPIMPKNLPDHRHTQCSPFILEFNLYTDFDLYFTSLTTYII